MHDEPLAGARRRVVDRLGGDLVGEGLIAVGTGGRGVEDHRLIRSGQAVGEGVEGGLVGHLDAEGGGFVGDLVALGVGVGHDLDGIDLGEVVAVLLELLGDGLLEGGLLLDHVVSAVVVDPLVELVVHITHPYNHLDRYPKM